MSHRATLQRLGAWLGRFTYPTESGELTATSPMRAAAIDATSVAVLESGATPCTPIHACNIVAAARSEAVDAPETGPDRSPAALAPQHERGLHLAATHRWNWAQRELEQAARAEVHGPAAADLASVREVRRQLRVLRKWPRDISAHLALGRCYFELGLGTDAEDTFRYVLTLAPAEPTALYFLALEYAFRGAWPTAEEYYTRARALAADLPPFADWRRAIETTTGEGPTAGGAA